MPCTWGMRVVAAGRAWTRCGAMHNRAPQLSAAGQRSMSVDVKKKAVMVAATGDELRPSWNRHSQLQVPCIPTSLCGIQIHVVAKHLCPRSGKFLELCLPLGELCKAFQCVWTTETNLVRSPVPGEVSDASAPDDLAGQHHGKTTVTLGMVNMLLERGLKVGYQKPVGQQTVPVMDGALGELQARPRPFSARPPEPFQRTS
jgi:hypothetical protein